MSLAEVLFWLHTTTAFGNSFYEYAWALLYLLGLLIIFHLVQLFLVRWAAKLALRTRTEFDDVLVRVVQTVKPPFYLFIAFYLSVRTLALTSVVTSTIRIALVVWVAFQVVLALQVAIDSAFRRRLKREEHTSHKSILEVMRAISRFALWTVGLLFVLSNVGVNISSLIAGLGISGIAIALATQNILSDLFSSLVIYFDQPFSPGDFIEVGQDMGTVQKIGIKTTRIQSLRGEEIIIPNKDIAAARVKNFKRLTQRRVEFTFGVPAELSSEALTRIPELVKAATNGVSHVWLERVHLHQLLDGEPQFTVVYFVRKQEYNAYMDAHQTVLLNLRREFEIAKIQLR